MNIILVHLGLVVFILKYQYTFSVNYSVNNTDTNLNV